MRRPLVIAALLAPTTIAAQTPTPANPPLAVLGQFVRFADIFGSRLVAAFDSIPASRYDFRPVPSQQTVGYIAQHLEDANYELCSRLGSSQHRRAMAKDSLADTIKARWPKDTLVARLQASLRFCDAALEGVEQLNTAQLASTLLAFETDLAEHYSQISVYMRLLGLIPPSALPPRKRTAIVVSEADLRAYVGTYDLGRGQQFVITMNDGALSIRSTPGGATVRLWPEGANDFFVKEVDAQISFTRGGNERVTGLVLHQYGRDSAAKKLQ